MEEDFAATLFLEGAQGGNVVVLRAAGSLKNVAAEKKFDFDCRLIAYAGCAEVRIVVTLVNRQGRTAEFIPLEAFFLELPTAVQQGKCLFGTETGELIEGSLDGRTEAYVYQSSSDEHVFGGGNSTIQRAWHYALLSF